jgi:predicted RNA-binding protein with PUA-like domain
MSKQKPKACWLMKSEPDVYSIVDLRRDGSTSWEGVRNYLARNNMREMKVGDAVLFYHSNATPPGVVGVARVVREAYPDPCAFDPTHHYFDAKSDPEKPRWDRVDIAFEEAFPRMVSLPEIRDMPALAGMELLAKSRLSVQRVGPDEFDRICGLGRSA